MAKAWIRDRWLKSKAVVDGVELTPTTGMKRQVAANPDTADVPAALRTADYGRGMRWQVCWRADGRQHRESLPTREAAEARAAAAAAHEQALATFHTEHAAVSEKMTTATAEARTRSEELLAALTQASEDLRGRLQSAWAEAEDIKAGAISEAAAIVAQARADAEDKLTETDAELAARNDRLKQDNRLLRQRKQALLTQLAQLSSLATETASEFPEDEATGPIPAALVAEPEVGGDDGIDETPEDQDGQ